VVNKANTTTAVTSAPNPSVFGQSVTFTATVSAVAPVPAPPQVPSTSWTAVSRSAAARCRVAWPPSPSRRSR
jgi:hypothetical protein